MEEVSGGVRKKCPKGQIRDRRKGKMGAHNCRSSPKRPYKRRSPRRSPSPKRRSPSPKKASPKRPSPSKMIHLQIHEELCDSGKEYELRSRKGYKEFQEMTVTAENLEQKLREYFEEDLANDISITKSELDHIRSKILSHREEKGYVVYHGKYDCEEQYFKEVIIRISRAT